MLAARLESLMPIPGHQTFMRPLLEFLADGNERGVKEVYAALADRFALTDEDRQEMLPSGTQRLLDNRVGWAKTYLLKAGLLESPRRAVVRITESGRGALASTECIDNRYLRRFPEFLNFMSAPETEPTETPVNATAASSAPPAPERTPEELIAVGYRQIQDALASDLLERVKGSSPTFFDRLVVELLVENGLRRVA